MGIRQAVAYLSARDYCCSVSTVRNLVHAGKLRCYRPGVSGRGRYEFSAARLDEFLRREEIGATGQGTDAPAPRRPATRTKPEPKPAAPDWRDRLEKVIQS